jgi:protein-serine/threonine kinase
LKGFASGSKNQAAEAEPQAIDIDDFLRSSDSQGQQLPTAPVNPQSRTTSYGTQGSAMRQDELNFTDVVNPGQFDQYFAGFYANPETKYHGDYNETPRAVDRGLHNGDPHLPSDSYHFQQQQSVHPDQSISNYAERFNPKHENSSRQSMHSARSGKGANVLQKNHRRFTDAYEKDPSHHGGSSGPARKVMDFFRRRGKARAGDDQ